MENNEFSHTVVRTKEQAENMIECIGTPLNIAFDFETTGLDPFVDEVWGMSIAADSTPLAFYIPKETISFILDWFTHTISNPFVFTWGFNLKFDWHFLDKLANYPTISHPLDAMTLAWMLDENSEVNLKGLAGRYLGIEHLPDYKDLIRITKQQLKLKKLEDVRISDIDPNILAEYAARDAYLTLHLAEVLIPKAIEEKLWDPFLNFETPFLRVLKKMEATGIYVHKEGLLSVKTEWESKLVKLQEHWNEATGGINHNSNPQLVKWFYESNKQTISLTTKTGNPSVDIMALRRIMETCPTAKVLVEMREIEKLIGTYVNKFLESPDSILRGNFGQTGTVTGRLNSSSPNLQNIPARGELGSQIKNYLGAPPGYKWVSVDYSQIELRLIAHYSKSPEMIKVFAEGLDPHQMTADLVNVDRHTGKTLNFSWAYGAGPRKLCDTVEKNGKPRPKESDAKKWLARFAEAYPELVNLKQQVIRVATQRGYLITLLGRHRHMPELKHFDEDIRSRAERQCINSLIQGGVGDLMKWAMIRLDPFLTSLGARIAVQVHDELGIIAPDETADQVAKIAKEIMESVKENFMLSIPITAEPTIAQTWGEAKGK